MPRACQQVDQAESDSGRSVPSGSVMLPRTRMRMGTGALPIVTQSLISELPASAQLAASDSAAKAQTMTHDYPKAQPQPLATAQSAINHSMITYAQGTALSLAAHAGVASQTLVSQLSGDEAVTENVWGVVRSQTGMGDELSEESVRPVRSRDKKEVHVTPRTRHK